VPQQPIQSTTDRKSFNMKKFTAVLVMLMLGFLAGCNTMEGMGKDIERGGEKLQGSAQENK